MDKTRQPSAAVLKLREYLRTAPQEELDARMARVKEMNLPNGPYLIDLINANRITNGPH